MMKIKVDAETDEQQKTQLTLEWNVHKVQAERSYQQLKEDAAYAKSHQGTEMLTFDLEKSLPTPVLSTYGSCVLQAAALDLQPWDPQQRHRPCKHEYVG